MSPATDTRGGRPVAEAQPTKKITRDDIHAKFAELSQDVDQQAEAAKSTAMTVAAVAGVVVVVAVFLFGRSRGKKKTTIIEVRRF